jgi:hypothetical protein
MLAQGGAGIEDKCAAREEPEDARVRKGVRCAKDSPTPPSADGACKSCTPVSRLISVVGTPSPTLYATMNVVRALVQVILGDHLVVVANSVEALRKEFPSAAARKGRPLILLSDYAAPEMLAILYQSNAPLAVCADDFITIAHCSVVSRGFGGLDAARFAMMGLVNVERAMVSPPPLALIVNDPNSTLATLISDLAALYRLPMDDGSFNKILTFIGCAGQRNIKLGQYAAKAVTVANNARETLERRSPLENELIDFLAPQYDGIARGRRLKKLEWPVYALLRPEFPDRLTIGPIDLTGPARFIYHGPYFALPAGTWSADVSIEVSECYADDPIEIDVTAHQTLAVVRAKLPRAGIYGCQILFRVEDPSQPIELRLRLLTGAIEGVIRMHRITLHRISGSEADEGAEASLGA